MNNKRVEDSNRAYLLNRFLDGCVSENTRDIRNLQELFIPIYKEICDEDYLFILNKHSPSYIGHVGSNLLVPTMHGKNTNPHISVVFDYQNSNTFGGEQEGDATHSGGIYPGAILYIGKTIDDCFRHWIDLKKDPSNSEFRSPMFSI